MSGADAAGDAGGPDRGAGPARAVVGRSAGRGPRHYGLSPADLARRGDHAGPHTVAAWPGRRYTPVRLRELCRAGLRPAGEHRGDPRPARRTGRPGTPDSPGTWRRFRAGCWRAGIAGGPGTVRRPREVRSDLGVRLRPRRQTLLPGFRPDFDLGVRLCSWSLSWSRP